MQLVVPTQPAAACAVFGGEKWGERNDQAREQGAAVTDLSERGRAPMGYGPLLCRLIEYRRSLYLFR